MEGTMGTIKAAVIAVAAAILAHTGWLAIPLALLVICNVMDYGTGIVAAPYRGQTRSSAAGIRGIVKKIGGWLLVGVGVLVDVLLAYLAEYTGLQFSLGFAVGSVVCVWLLVNEMVSVVENVADMGVKVPFLMPLIKWVRRSTEEVANKALPKGEEPKSEEGTGEETEEQSADG